jgi:hypothetical protein
MYYCPTCKRVYFLPPGNTYLCNNEGNFGLPSGEPWAIPEYVDYDKTARTLECLFGACHDPTYRHPSRNHDFELLKREQVAQGHKEAVLIEAA